MVHLVLLTSNCSSRKAFFRAGGIRFIADIIPYLSDHFDIDFYVAGRENDDFDFRGAHVHIVKSPKIPFVDKRFLPHLGVDADILLYLDYVAALSPNSTVHSATVFHHLAQSFNDENPVLYREYFGRAGQRYLRVENLALRRVLRKSRTALSVSDVTVPYLRSLGFDVTVVGNGIDVSRYFVGPKEGYAVVIGRLVNYKRVDWAIRVAERTGIPLKIIGTGPLEGYLKRISPKNVEFLGYVDEGEKIKMLSRAKYLFAFSAFEGFDLPVIEAMAVGAVPVISDIRAHRFVFAGRDVGFLVNSVEEAVEALDRLERDDDLYDALSANGRALVEEKWNASVVAHRYLRILDGLLEGGARA